MGEFVKVNCYIGSLGRVTEVIYTKGFTRLLQDTGEFFEFYR